VGFRRGGGSARLGGMRDNDFTKILGWPGYRAYRTGPPVAAVLLFAAGQLGKSKRVGQQRL